MVQMETIDEHRKSDDKLIRLEGRSPDNFNVYFASIISAENVQTYLSLLDFSIYEYYRRVAMEDSRYDSDRAELLNIFGPEKWQILSHSLENPYPLLISICARRNSGEPYRRDDFNDVDISEMALRIVNEHNVFKIYDLLTESPRVS